MRGPLGAGSFITDEFSVPFYCGKAWYDIQVDCIINIWRSFVGVYLTMTIVSVTTIFSFSWATTVFKSLRKQRPATVTLWSQLWFTLIICGNGIETHLRMQLTPQVSFFGKSFEMNSLLRPYPASIMLSGQLFRWCSNCWFITASNIMTVIIQVINLRVTFYSKRSTYQFKSALIKLEAVY